MTRSRIAREAIPLALYFALVGLGYAFGAIATGALAGGILAGIVRMRIRDASWATIGPRWHIAWTILLSTGTAALLLGWSRSWKSFIVNMVLAPLPILFAIIVFGWQFSPQVQEQNLKGAEQLAILERNIELVEKDVEIIRREFEEGNLVLLANENMRDDGWDMFEREQWPLDLMRLAFEPARWVKPDLPTKSLALDVSDATRWDSVAGFYSRAASEAGMERRAAHVFEETGMTTEEILATDEGFKTLGAIEGPEYQGIITLTCAYDSVAGELISMSIMPLYQLDPMKIEVFKPLREVCETAASGGDLSHLPSDISSN